MNDSNLSSLDQLLQDSMKRSQAMRELNAFVRDSVDGKIAKLEAENARLRVLLNRGVVLMPLWFSPGWITEVQAALAGEKEAPGE